MTKESIMRQAGESPATFKAPSLEIDMNNWTDEDCRLAVEEIDPDWPDHNATIENAIDFYRNSDEFKEALQRIVSERNG